jgi:hypothetical protein
MSVSDGRIKFPCWLVEQVEAGLCFGHLFGAMSGDPTEADDGTWVISQQCIFRMNTVRGGCVCVSEVFVLEHLVTQFRETR